MGILDCLRFFPFLAEPLLIQSESEPHSYWYKKLPTGVIHIPFYDIFKAVLNPRVLFSTTTRKKQKGSYLEHDQDLDWQILQLSRQKEFTLKRKHLLFQEQPVPQQEELNFIII